MKLNAIRDFLAVAERGSLRAAARQLGIAQAGISHSIRELERELGVALFERRSTGVVLTPMGEVFRVRASTATHELRRARDEVDQLRGRMHGLLTVAMSSVPHISLLPQVLKPFRAKYPGVRLDIIDAVYPGIEAGLLSGEIDFYVGPAPRDPSSALALEKLFDNTRVIVGRAGHPLGHAKSLAALADAEWITSSVTHRDEEELGPLFAQLGLPPPRLMMRAHSALTFASAMANSDLLMMLPRQWTRSPLFAGLQEIRVKEKLPAPPICLLARGGLPLTPAADHFCDLLRRAVRHMALRPGRD